MDKLEQIIIKPEGNGLKGNIEIIFWIDRNGVSWFMGNNLGRAESN